MNLQQQVCSLEHAKKLLTLGVKQNSLFYYQNEPYNDGEDDIEIKIKEPIKNLMNVYDINTKHELYSAFTVAELFDLLPACIDSKFEEPFNFYWLNIHKRTAPNIRYIANYKCDSYGPPDYAERYLLNHNISDETLANCLAKLLIYLLENKLMEIPK